MNFIMKKEVTLQDPNGKLCNLETFIKSWWSESDEDYMYDFRDTNSIISSIANEKNLKKNIYFLKNIVPILEVTGRVRLLFRGYNVNNVIKDLLVEQEKRLVLQKENTKELEKTTVII